MLNHTNENASLFLSSIWQKTALYQLTHIHIHIITHTGKKKTLLENPQIYSPQTSLCFPIITHIHNEQLTVCWLLSPASHRCLYQSMSSLLSTLSLSPTVVVHCSLPRFVCSLLSFIARCVCV